MVKKLFFLVVPLFLLVFVSVVNAQTGTDSATKLKQQRKEFQTQAKEKRNELRQQIKDRVQTKREEAKEMVLAKREEFKAKLQTIRDEKKKALVERIDTKLSAINTKHTDRFAQVLSNLQALLDKISQDADATKAQAAIDTAKAAVETQGAKTYTITISAEIALRLDVGSVTSQLRQDLVATHKVVVDAKQAVQTLRKNDAMIRKEATNSANL